MRIISLTVLGMTACGDQENIEADSAPETTPCAVTESAPTYEQITAEEAKTLMDTEADYIIIDARTKEEFAESHIEGAILIPEHEIADRAEDELPDKDQLIFVYCRSGRRSKSASQALAELGYTNVKEFGGIIDWPYEVVKPCPTKKI